MKSKVRHITILVLGMLTMLPGICFAQQAPDTLLLNKMWNYRRYFGHELTGETPNMYVRYTLETERRNPSLFLVPSMYSVAKGNRKFVSESYGKIKFDDEQHWEMQRQVSCGTIPHNRQISKRFSAFLAPNIYGMTLYEDRLLSPFHRTNRRYYRYNVYYFGNQAHVTFTPKLENTQLVKGRAVVDPMSGRIKSVTFHGEYDMIDFDVNMMAADEDTNAMLPLRCSTNARFRFLGNRIKTNFLATYHSETTLPDTIRNVEDRQLMDSLRTVPLMKEEEDIYRQYDEDRETAEAVAKRKQEEKSGRSLGDMLSSIGGQLTSSQDANSGKASVHLAPLLNPQYVSYSKRHGLSYRIQLGLAYRFNKFRFLTLQPQLGYNFKIKQLFYVAPLRFTYNPKRNGYAEITVANGNRITNSSVQDAISQQIGDTIDLDKFDLDLFNDMYVQAVNNIEVSDWLEITAGLVYHLRTAVNKYAMIYANRPTTYRSFAPLITLHLSPFRHGPYFMLSYERGIKGILNSNLEYGRIEFDVTHQFKLSRMRLLNLRAGMGLYPNQSTTYFLDYANFRDENLPQGWDDDWTGQFQLLDSRWYNNSKYYLRANASFESPMLCLSFLPWLGRAIETERIYLSTLSIQHTRAYSEIGYGLSTRFFSMGVFASFLNLKYREFGCKFTFELFRDW